jgi:hypothetical protein
MEVKAITWVKSSTWLLVAAFMVVMFVLLLPPVITVGVRSCFSVDVN